MTTPRFFLIAAPVSLPAPTRELFNSEPLRENVSIAIEMFGESLPAERLRVGKHRDYLRESIKGIRIAVRENERKRIRECRADAQLSPQERIELVKVDRWVAYARADAVLTHLNSLLHYPPYDRMPCMLLYGLPGMGKTKILQKFLRDHPSSFDETEGVSRNNVIGIEMPPDADEHNSSPSVRPLAERTEM
jgi:hypothetical protein